MLNQSNHKRWQLIFVLAVLILVYMTQWKMSSQTTTSSTARAATCELKANGDASCDGIVDITDFEVFRKEYIGEVSTTVADFDGDGTVTVADFEIWRRGYFAISPTAAATIGPTLPQSTDCRVPYTSTSPWNTPIGTAKIDAKSSSYIGTLVKNLGSDTTTFTMAVYPVTSSTPLKSVKVAANYSNVSAPNSLQVQKAVTVSIPIPVGALPANGTDSQIILVNYQTGDEWGLWQATPNADGTWSSKNGYHYNINWSGVPPSGFISRGAGVPYLTGLIRPCEIKQGHIDHVVAFAYEQVSNGFVYPATKSDGTAPFPGMPEGTHLQLDPAITDAQLTAKGCTNACLTIAHAMQKYGMFIIDFAGHPKIYAEYEGSAHWTSLPSQQQVVADTVTEKKIPYTWWRVVQ